MLIEYSSPKVKAYFDNIDKLERKCSKPLSAKIIQRLFEIRAYPNLKVLYEKGVGRPHKLKGNLEDYIALTLSDKDRLLIEWPKQVEQSEFEKVTQIFIKGVCDYHGGKIKWIVP
ncbi:MAG: hypothetical protein ACI4L1_02525 [Christensenellales bacterium]